MTILQHETILSKIRVFSLARLNADVDECVSQPCKNLGVCEDLVNGYTCHCIAGVTGVYCQTGERLFNLKQAVAV